MIILWSHVDTNLLDGKYCNVMTSDSDRDSDNNSNNVNVKKISSSTSCSEGDDNVVEVINGKIQQLELGVMSAFALHTGAMVNINN